RCSDLVLGGKRGQAPTGLLGIDISTEPDSGKVAGALASHFAQPMHTGADGPAIGFDPVFLDKRHQGGSSTGLRMGRIDVGTRDNSLHKTFGSDMIHTRYAHSVA